MVYTPVVNAYPLYFFFIETCQRPRLTDGPPPLRGEKLGALPLLGAEMLGAREEPPPDERRLGIPDDLLEEERGLGIEMLGAREDPPEEERGLGMEMLGAREDPPEEERGLGIEMLGAREEPPEEERGLGIEMLGAREDPPEEERGLGIEILGAREEPPEEERGLGIEILGAREDPPEEERGLGIEILGAREEPPPDERRLGTDVPRRCTGAVVGAVRMPEVAGERAPVEGPEPPVMLLVTLCGRTGVRVICPLPRGAGVDDSRSRTAMSVLGMLAAGVRLLRTPPPRLLGSADGPAPAPLRRASWPLLTLPRVPASSRTRERRCDSGMNPEARAVAWPPGCCGGR